MTDVAPPPLTDRYRRTQGTVSLTGVQALARLPLDVRRLDLAAGRSTAAFISGYEGSPLGGYDLELGRQRELLAEHDIVFRPAVNEELAATAVQGSQLAGTRPEKRVDGIVGFWYGKSPGLDRSADALRHNNLAGTHPDGGVVALVGDDPAAKSSTFPGASEQLLADLGMPTLYPGDPAEALRLGMHAVALSRACGLWVAMKIATNVADAAGQIMLGPDDFAPVLPEVLVDGRPYRHQVTASLLQPVLGGLEESRNGIRLEIARSYAAVNALNEVSGHSSGDRVGIVAAGTTFLDLRQALETLGLDEDERARRGVRLLHLRMINPVEPGVVSSFAEGLQEIIVVEEKRAFLEPVLKDQLYGRANAPVVTGKRHPDGSTAFASSGELDPDTIAAVLATRLLALGDFPSVSDWRDRTRSQQRRISLPLVTRTPFFCSGCPHNTSTKVPEGALVGGGIGCHGLVLGMAAQQVGEVSGLTQMGGEGAQWLGMAPFVERRHMFQNLGDGTFHHSGSLAVRAAVAGQVDITYKLLHNSAVAMTGGQHAEGAMSVPDITRSLTAEGVRKIIVTTDDPKTYRGVRLATGATVWHRDRIIEAQELLASTPGVTVLIHDQECSTELRRKRKRGLVPDPVERVMINERVCEGCGDCGRKSNCLSVHPVDTEFGRKTRIDQHSCNKDYSCLSGECPAFLTIKPSKHVARDRAQVSLDSLPEPGTATGSGHRTTRIVGIGGSGVVTLSQILAAAAAIDDQPVTTLDQTGVAQKGGVVISDVKIGPDAGTVAHKAASGEVDLYIGSDLLAAADQRHLAATDPQRTLAVVSTARTPTGAMVTDVGTPFPDTGPLISDIRRATRATEAVFIDARRTSAALFGDDQFANLILIGVAHQLGALPLAASAVEQAIRLNGVRTEENIQAFRRGRQYVADRRAFDAAVPTPSASRVAPDESVVATLLSQVGCPIGSELAGKVGLRIGELIAFQSRRYAEQYVEVVARTYRAEQQALPGSVALSVSVAQHLYKLMAYKDEYEVARLSLLPEVTESARRQFGAGATVSYRLHPPTLRALGMRNKITLGPWFRSVYAALGAARRLRGTVLDPFGYAHVRRVERALVSEYRDVIDTVVRDLTGENVGLATQIADLPDLVRGYEDVKLATVDAYHVRLAELLTRYDVTLSGSGRPR